MKSKTQADGLDEQGLVYWSSVVHKVPAPPGSRRKILLELETEQHATIKAALKPEPDKDGEVIIFYSAGENGRKVRVATKRSHGNKVELYWQSENFEKRFSRMAE